MGGPLHILCIDDEDDIQNVVRLCLSFDGGFSVSACKSGTEALDFLDQVRPDLILLDAMMPRMDGPATLEAIRTLQAARDIPVIFMTPRGQAGDAERYLRLGAIGVVPKPFDPVTLASEIRKAFGSWAIKARIATGAR